MMMLGATASPAATAVPVLRNERLDISLLILNLLEFVLIESCGYSSSKSTSVNLSSLIRFSLM